MKDIFNYKNTRKLKSESRQTIFIVILRKSKPLTGGKGNEKNTLLTKRTAQAKACE